MVCAPRSRLCPSRLSLSGGPHEEQAQRCGRVPTRLQQVPVRYEDDPNGCFAWISFFKTLSNSYCIAIFFFVHRNKDRKKVTTRIRKVSGDQDAFIRELRAVLLTDKIHIRRGGTIEVDGNHVKSVREWLAGLGF
jgi:hypothetical protein